MQLYCNVALARDAATAILPRSRGRGTSEAGGGGGPKRETRPHCHPPLSRSSLPASCGQPSAQNWVARTSRAMTTEGGGLFPTHPCYPPPMQPPSPILETTEQAIRLAKTLLRTARSGALATLEPGTGWPIATRVGVSTDSDGAPVILISRLAAHTGALLADPPLLAAPRLSRQGRSAGPSAPLRRLRGARSRPRHPRAPAARFPLPRAPAEGRALCRPRRLPLLPPRAENRRPQRRLRPRLPAGGGAAPQPGSRRACRSRAAVDRKAQHFTGQSSPPGHRRRRRGPRRRRRGPPHLVRRSRSSRPPTWATRWLARWAESEPPRMDKGQGIDAVPRSEERVQCPPAFHGVIPAKAGTSVSLWPPQTEIPAFAGMTR